MQLVMKLILKSILLNQKKVKTSKINFLIFKFRAPPTIVIHDRDT